MAGKMETLMLIALLGGMAFSLQGCKKALTAEEVKAKDEVNKYKAAAATGMTDKEVAAYSKTFQSAGACPAFRAGVTESKTTVVTRVKDKALGVVACQTNFKDPACGDKIAFELSDLTIFYLEKDPLFKKWQEGKVANTASGKSGAEAWAYVKTDFTDILKKVYVPVVTLLQNSVVKTQAVLSFKDVSVKKLKEELSQVQEAVSAAFCPAPDAAVAKAVVIDKPAVDAKKEATAAADNAKEKALEAENAADEAGEEAEKEVIKEKAEAGIPAKSKEIPAAAGDNVAASNVAGAAADTAGEAADQAEKSAEAAGELAVDAASKVVEPEKAVVSPETPSAVADPTAAAEAAEPATVDGDTMHSTDEKAEAAAAEAVGKTTAAQAEAAAAAAAAPAVAATKESEVAATTAQTAADTVKEVAVESATEEAKETAGNNAGDDNKVATAAASVAAADAQQEAAQTATEEVAKETADTKEEAAKAEEVQKRRLVDDFHV